MKVLHQKYYVNFDSEGEIRKEYFDCLAKSSNEKKPGIELLRKWVVEIINKSARNHSGILPENHYRELRKMKFDKDDLYFIAVCHRGNSKFLIAEESDYNIEVKKYLKTQMGIDVYPINKAIELC
jgi:hypothetical protein